LTAAKDNIFSRPDFWFFNFFGLFQLFEKLEKRIK